MHHPDQLLKSSLSVYLSPEQGKFLRVDRRAVAAAAAVAVAVEVRAHT